MTRAQQSRAPNLHVVPSPSITNSTYSIIDFEFQELLLDSQQTGSAMPPKEWTLDIRGERDQKKKKSLYGTEWLVVNTRPLRESTISCAMMGLPKNGDMPRQVPLLLYPRIWPPCGALGLA